MHIALLCATKRGYRVAEKLFELGHGHEYTVFSFRETPWEPPYMDDIRALTLAQGYRFIEARNVANAKLREFWRQFPVDLILMVSWRYLVPAEILEGASCGSFVFHDSLLPKYRGFAPTVWSIINGESETGVTLFRASEEVDAGDIVEQRKIAIGENDYIADVMVKVTDAYLAIAERNLSALLKGRAKMHPQNHAEATYTCKWTPADARIDWRKSSREIYNLIRATSRPYPGAYSFLENRKLTVWSAAMLQRGRTYVSRVPGRVVESITDHGAVVLTGDGSILLQSVQLEGEPIANASRVLRSPSQTLRPRMS